MQTATFLTAFLLAATVTCNKQASELREGQVTLTYHATQCADPWQNSSDDNITAQNVKAYLEAQGVPVASLKIQRSSDGAVCAACSCPSGKTIYVTVQDNDSLQAKLRGLKFQ